MAADRRRTVGVRLALADCRRGFSCEGQYGLGGAKTKNVVAPRRRPFARPWCSLFRKAGFRGACAENKLLFRITEHYALSL